MDKLNKLAMPDVKSGTPQEKMNAVKKALQSLEMMTEAYNQIVPVINAKIDWLAEVEKAAKDDTQDKKIDELIAVNKVLLGRIAKLEAKPDYNDSAITKRISALELKPDYKYDDKPLKKMIADITNSQGELARTQNALSKEIKAIEIPKAPSIEPLRKRIKALEDKPQYVYDDKALKERVKKLEGAPKYVYDDKPLKVRIAELERKPEYNDKPLKERVAALESKPELPATESYDDSDLLRKLSVIEKSVESLDKRLDFIKRTYSEKWQLAEFERTKFQQSISKEIKAIETPQDVDLSGIEERIDNLESVEHVEYDDKPVLKEIDSIKKELSDVKKSFNEIFE